MADQVVDLPDDWVAWRATMTTEHETLKQGVSNFRQHAARANSYFDRSEAVWEADKTRRARNWKVAMFVAIFAVPAVTWAGGKLVTALYQILQIEEQWQQAHPSEFVKPHASYLQPNPQDARTELAK
jgi:hypothetical protein